MAQIRVIRRPSPLVPWLLGALAVVALLVWGVLAWTRPPVPEGEVYPPGQQPPPPPGAGPALPSPAEVDIRAGFTAGDLAEAVRRMTAHLETIIARERARDEPVGQHFQQFRERAEALIQDRAALQDAGRVREVLMAATALMEHLQTGRFPEDADELSPGIAGAHAAAESLDPARPTLEQHELVQRYFADASRVLRAMSRLAGPV
jgi:hypothetical protein